MGGRVGELDKTTPLAVHLISYNKGLQPLVASPLRANLRKNDLRWKNMFNPTFIFKVKLAHNKRIYREIEMFGEQTLDDLHHAIFKAFDFEEMHLYSFYMSGKAWDNSTEYASPYCLKRMAGDVTKSAKKAKINSLKLKPKQRFLYLFDFGDCWEFEVEFISNAEFNQKVKYFRIIKKIGRSPEQYG